MKHYHVEITPDLNKKEQIIGAYAKITIQSEENLSIPSLGVKRSQYFTGRNGMEKAERWARKEVEEMKRKHLAKERAITFKL